jgi:hypothetical protein
VTDSVVVHFTLNCGWVSEVREFGEEAVDRCAASDGLDLWDQPASGLCRYRQRRDQYAVISAVQQEAKMREEVHPNEGVYDVGYHKPPREIPA